MKRFLIFFAASLIFAPSFGQSIVPDALFGKNHLPVWNQIVVPESDKPWVRTYFSFSTNDLDSLQTKSEIRLYSGIGRAFYDKRGNLLWVQDGYAAKRPTCATQLDGELMLAGENLYLLENDTDSIRVKLHLLENGHVKGITKQATWKVISSIDWTDAPIETLPKNPCK